MKTAFELARCIDGAVMHGDPEVIIRGVAHDSREVTPGDLFAVLSGAQTHGRVFIEEALRSGAVALLVDALESVDVPQIVVDNVREKLGAVAAACYGWPTEQLAVVGITGTNGKTTTAYLVESALLFLGLRPGVMSTVEYRVGEHRWPAKHTTPEAPVIQAMAGQMVASGATHLIMEASSHGLAMGRLGGCQFRVVAFTNLTQDHLDFHTDMAEYAAAKLLLFTDAITDTPSSLVAVNVDDPFAETILAALVHSALTVSVDPGSDADIRPVEVPTFGIDGIDALLTTPDGEHRLRSPLLGEHNLSNLLLALGICVQLGIESGPACEALGGFQTVPGRLERVSSDEPFAVLVDYAHTPDALARVLMALRPLTDGRIICVFGCGGDRDATKRPLMGEAVRKSADVAVVTSDNPRTENAMGIIEMILPGVDSPEKPRLSLDALTGQRSGYVVVEDRRRAIQVALQAAKPGDTVLIAGKGHEDYQILGRERIHFDDREQARLALAGLRSGDNG